MKKETRRRQRWAIGAAALLLLTLLAPQARANHSMSAIALMLGSLLGWTATHPHATQVNSGTNTFAIGAFDRVDKIKQTLDFEYQRQWGHYILWRFKPLVGVALTGRRSLYAFGGLSLNIHFDKHIIVVPSETLTTYFHGGGKRLGSVVNFRSGLNIEWEFNDGVRIGLGFHHMSHWFLFNNYNPGTEVLNFDLTIPVQN